MWIHDVVNGAKKIGIRNWWDKARDKEVWRGVLSKT